MSDPARDGYECHGPMIALISGGEDGGLGLICTVCGVTKNMVRNDPRLRALVDDSLYAAAKIVSGQPVGDAQRRVFSLHEKMRCARRRKRYRIRRYAREVRYWKRKANRVI